MFKTSMTVMLLTTAQEAFARRGRGDRNPERQELMRLVDAEIARLDYDFTKGRMCTENRMRNMLKRQIKNKKVCEEYARNDRRRRACATRYDRIIARYEDCVASSTETPVPSDSPDSLVSSDSDSAPTVAPSDPTVVSSDSDSVPTVAPSDPTVVSSDSDSVPTVAPSDPTVVSSDDDSIPTVAPSDPTVVSSDDDSVPTVAPSDPTVVSSDDDSVPTVAPSDPTVVSSDDDSVPTVAPSDPTVVSSDDDSVPTVAPSDPTVVSSDDDSVPTVAPSDPTVVSSDDDSVPTVAPSDPTVVSSDDDSVPTVVDPYANQCGGLLPEDIPDGCKPNQDGSFAGYTCAEILEVYQYTLTRVTEHNARRQLHENTPDVTHNLDIACQAKTWSKHMAVNNHWGHAPSATRPGQGENLAYSGSTGTLGTFTPELGWYEKEIIYYNWVTGETTDTVNDPPTAVGHFTQMVWDTTTAIGCAEARITRNVNGTDWNYAYSTCRYTPQGNIHDSDGLLTEHVKPTIIQPPPSPPAQ